MNRKIAFVPLVLAIAALTLSACSSSTPTASTGTPEPATPSPTTSAAVDTASTLDGGVIIGDGFSVREISLEEAGVEISDFDGVRLIRQSENTLLLEAGGSGSEACKSNFSSISFANGTITLQHRIGDGEERMCTMDYRFAVFSIESDAPIEAGTEVVILNSTDVADTLVAPE